MRANRERLRRWSIPLVTIVALLCASPVAAHRAGIPLALWGDFGSAALCQREIGFVTARCAAAAWQARRKCLETQLAGEGCDTAATDATVAQVHADTLDFLDSECGPDDWQPLNFLLGLELDNDIDTACLAAEVALVSGVFGPAQRPATSGPLDATTLTCTRSTARAATTLVRYAFDVWRRALDRIAVKSVPPTQKQALVDRARASIGQAQASLAQSLRADCSDADFAQIYGRSATAWLADIAKRADCLAGAGYVQSAVLCPAPVCGNGIQESGEQCDDGNTISGDGCHSDCTLEPAP